MLANLLGKASYPLPTKRIALPSEAIVELASEPNVPVMLHDCARETGPSLLAEARGALNRPRPVSCKCDGLIGRGRPLLWLARRLIKHG